jgi:hypothetical protein
MGNIVIIVPKGERIEVMQPDLEMAKYSTEGIPGAWMKVNHKGSIGYVFDGFTSSYPLREDWHDLSTYFFYKFRVAFCEYKESLHSKIVTSDGVVYTKRYFNKGRSFEETVTIHDIDIYEAIIFLKSFDYFNGFSLEQKFRVINDKDENLELNTADFVIDVKRAKDELGEQYQVTGVLTLAKDNSGKLVKIEYQTDNDGRNIISISGKNNKGVFIKIEHLSSK